MTPDRGLANEALRAAIQAATGLQTSLINAPAAPAAGEAYVVVHPIPSGGFHGGWSAPESKADWEYQVDGVGETDTQAQWAVDLVRSVLTNRDGGGNYVVPITAGNVAIIHRQPLEAGSPVPGGDLFSVSDTYLMKVSAL